MLRLKSQQLTPEKEALALPGAEPLTLLRVSNEHLPYACQCPLCGGIFEIPQGVLYKIEDDAYEDIDSGAKASGGPGISVENDFATATGTETPEQGTTESSATEVPMNEE